MNFTVHTIETAPEAAKDSLKGAQRSFGFLPNLLGVMAEAPISLKAYLDLTDLLGQSSLPPVEQQLLMLAISNENACDYCMSAHSTVAGMVGMPWPVLTALRGGSAIPDAKLEALRSFAIGVVRSRGRVDGRRCEELLASGYTQQNILEVIFAVAMKTLSNYTSHITQTPMDAEFLPQSWHNKPASATVTS